MVIIMVMIVVNIFKVKAKLSEYLEAVGRGERVVICKRNQPVAELRAVPSVRTEPRPIAGGNARFEVPESFFEPLPEEFIETFDEASSAATAAHVAERPEIPCKGSRRRKGRR
jgi:antitoxin (DNA-binding transcriptional repressor) of toxin-antitoxin stability system